MIRIVLLAICAWPTSALAHAGHGVDAAHGHGLELALAIVAGVAVAALAALRGGAR